MLDAKYFQDQVQDLETALLKRGFDASSIANLKHLSQSRKEIITRVESLKAKRNQVSQEVGKLKAQAKNNPEAAKQADDLVASMKGVGDEIKNLDEELKSAEEKLAALTFGIPNIPDVSVPVGKDSEDNKEVRKWGTPKQFSFQPKDHVDLGAELKILDLERAAKISGARFALYLGAGARLERALIQFMLDLHTQEHGYEEVIPPFMVNRKSMTGTGQLPKFEEDLFKTGMVDRELFLIPTSEVPLTNILQDEILEKQALPRYFTAYSPCFRSEAGAHGRDTRGLIRQHQFQKVELVKIATPETSFDELEKMVANAEKVLQLLELPYRVVLLCTGDMGFGSAKTYDIEVWLPSSSNYREISSCSNCTDFQARRAGIRFRPEAGAKPVLAHTLNGSGLAVGRTFIAILENFQQKDGSILIPKVLHRYLEGAPGFNRQGEQLFLVGRRDG